MEWFQLGLLFAVLCVGMSRGLFRKSSAYGSAGWTHPEAEGDLIASKRKGLPPGAFFLGESEKQLICLSREDTCQHTLIVGRSGTGKSRGWFLPNAALARGTSIVCTDPKGELYRYTSGFHAAPLRYAPAEPEASECLNWIPLCGDPRLSQLCARALVEAGDAKGDPAWLNLESAYLSALFAHASTLPEPTPLTAYRLFVRQTQEQLMEELLHSSSPVAVEEAMIFSQTQERIRGSIVPVVAGILQWLQDPRVARFTSASFVAPSFGALRRAPKAVYWCLREQDIARLRPLTSLFFTLLFEQLANEAVPEGSDIPVVALLDEFANVGVIPDFETTISLARGRGMALVLGIQGLSQLEARYGKANAQTILANCGTKIALSGLDVETGEYVSRAVGQATVQCRRRAQHWPSFLMGAPSVTVTPMEHGRPLLTADEVRRIGKDEAIVITGNRRPMVIPKSLYAAKPHPALPPPPLGHARALELSPYREESLLPPFPVELLQAPKKNGDACPT